MSSESTSSPSRISRLLLDCGRDPEAFDRLIPAVLDDLRRIARRQLAREPPGHTLQPTALVSELYLRWSRQSGLGWRDRAHFFGMAAAQIRRILVDHARRKRAIKRAGTDPPLHQVDAGLPRARPASNGRRVDLIDLDRALDRLENLDSDLRRLVELRYFAGLSAREVAGVLGVTERTVMRRWAWVRAWLFLELNGGRPDHGEHDLETG